MENSLCGIFIMQIIWEFKFNENGFMFFFN